MYANYRLVKLYRRAVSKTPFKNAPTYTRIEYCSDTDDEILYHGFATSCPEFRKVPVLQVVKQCPLRDHAGNLTGEFGLRWVVRILNRHGQVLWFGLFDPETDEWDGWELKLFHPTKADSAVRGEKQSPLVNNSCPDNLRARLNHRGQGGCEIHGQTIQFIGYDGVDRGGTLQYVLLSALRLGDLEVGMAGVKATKTFIRWGVGLNTKMYPALWWGNYPYTPPAPGSAFKPEPYRWEFYRTQLDGKVAQSLRTEAVSLGAQFGVRLMAGAKVEHPQALPRFSLTRGMRTAYHMTVWAEAEYLVGKPEKASAATIQEQDDVELLDKMHQLFKLSIGSNKRLPPSMVGKVKKLMQTANTSTMRMLAKNYAEGMMYNEKLAGFINDEMASRRGRGEKLQHDYEQDTPAASILGNLT